MELKKLRSTLLNQRENSEGITYATSCTLLSKPAIDHNSNIEWKIQENDDNNDTIHIVLLDLETNGFSEEILQIAAKCQDNNFSIYVHPVSEIAATTTAMNGLSSNYGDLMYHGKKVSSVPLRVVLGELLLWLKSLEKKLCIATHNLAFDGLRLSRAMQKYSLTAEFAEVISSFADTLSIIRKFTGRKSKGSCTITGLAASLSIPSTGAHNAINDCEILLKILCKLKITKSMILENAISFNTKIEQWTALAKTQELLQTLTPMTKYVGKSIRKKLAKSGLTMEMLMNVYKKDSVSGIRALLKQKIETKEMEKLQARSIQNIINYFIDTKK